MPYALKRTEDFRANVKKDILAMEPTVMVKLTKFLFFCYVITVKRNLSKANGGCITTVVEASLRRQ